MRSRSARSWSASPQSCARLASSRGNFPVPDGARPLWELQLLARDSGSEPDANRWKAFAASFFPPAGPFLWLEDEYTLELDVWLVRDREIVR